MGCSSQPLSFWQLSIPLQVIAILFLFVFVCFSVMTTISLINDVRHVISAYLQMKKANKRLTSTRSMKMYLEILAGDGIIHLKTDSNFMYTYTCEMVKANRYPVLFSNDDLYHSGLTDNILSIKTYYEQQWLDRGLTIKYIKFVCEERDELVEPEVEIEYDPYRSFNRSKRSALASGK